MDKLKLELPESYFCEETKDGYLVSSHIKQVWAVNLDLLHEFDRVCKKYGLKYSGAFGTLLGAIRHKGFIPWDDDIDLIMFRDDYEKLCDIARKEFTDPYFFQTEDTDLGFSRPFARLRNSKTTAIQVFENSKYIHYNQGIFIDIFPLDYIPENDEEAWEFNKEAIKIREKMMYFSRLSTRYSKMGDSSTVSKVKNIIRFCISRPTQYVMETFGIHNPFVKSFTEISKKYDSYPTNRTFVIYGLKKNKLLFWETEDIRDTVDVPFETITIPAPRNYDKILTEYYGNWHKFVIGANQHGKMIYDVNTPYYEYRAGKK